MDYGIQGRVALVAAASKGLGQACAFGLAREGARLAICARNEAVLEQTATEISTTTGAEVFWRRADMSSAEDIQRLRAARFAIQEVEKLRGDVGPRPVQVQVGDEERRHFTSSILMMITGLSGASRSNGPYSPVAT